MLSIRLGIEYSSSLLARTLEISKRTIDAVIAARIAPTADDAMAVHLSLNGSGMYYYIE